MGSAVQLAVNGCKLQCNVDGWVGGLIVKVSWGNKEYGSSFETFLFVGYSSLYVIAL